MRGDLGKILGKVKGFLVKFLGSIYFVIFVPRLLYDLLLIINE